MRYRTACPAPPQPLLTLPPCVIGPQLIIVTDLSPSAELVYEFIGNGVTGPLPYTALEFTVEAVNGAGSVESVYSESVITLSSGRLILC